MKVLVTGANGQVGSYLSQVLQEQQWDFQALTRSQLDITNEQAVNSVMEKYRPDVVINAAAYTAVDRAESESDLADKINHLGAKYLARSASAIDAAIFHISTDYVFSGDAVESYVEDSPTDPQSVYGLTKLAGDRAVAIENTSHIILRTAWVFGEHGNNFVKTMLKLAKTRDSLSVVGDQYGGPTFAKDIALCLVSMLEKYKADQSLDWGVYHFSGTPCVSWCEFANCIFESAVKQGLLAKPPQVTSIPTSGYPTPARRPVNSRLNCEKIFQAFGINSSNWIDAIDDLNPYIGD